jgi:hypothetical protein
LDDSKFPVRKTAVLQNTKLTSEQCGKALKTLLEREEYEEIIVKFDKRQVKCIKKFNGSM